MGGVGCGVELRCWALGFSGCLLLWMPMGIWGGIRVGGWDRFGGIYGDIFSGEGW